MSERLPGVSRAELIRALERAGLRVVREGGQHTIMWKEGLPRPVPIRRHAGQVRLGLLLGIVKQAGLTPEEFLAYLRR